MKNKIIETGKKLDSKGFAPGISGNISVRTDRGLLISGSGKKLSELASIMDTYPQVLKNVRVRDKKEAREDAQVQEVNYEED